LIVGIQEDPDFDSFDRMYFIRELGDPAYGALTSLQKALNINSGGKIFYIKPVNDEVNSLFDVNFLHPGYYSKQDQQQSNPELKNLGKILFFDPILSIKICIL
jgi:cytochrome c peroxidase